MSTNFLQHNPTETNQEDDPTYANDTTRTGGLGVDQIVPSKWMNKALYQTTTMVAALGQMMSAKGYSNADSMGVNGLAGVLANILTNADIKPNAITVPYSPTPTFDCSLANSFVFSMGGPVTSSSFINYSQGQVITLTVGNPSNFPFAFPANVRVAFAPYTNYGNDDWIFSQQFVGIGGNLYPLTSEILNILQALGGKQDSLGFTPVQQGGGSGQGSNKVYIGWDGAGLKAQVDGTDLGRFLFGSALPSGSMATNGYISIPLSNGQVASLQWATGNVDSGAGTVYQTVYLPFTFPNAIFGAWPATNWISSNDDDLMIYQVSSKSTNSVTVRRGRRGDDSNYVTTPTVFAIGY